MAKQVTFTHILTLLAIIIIPLMLWGLNVEVRFEQVIDNTKEISILKEETKNSDMKTQENHNEVMLLLHNIELQLKDKKDR